MITSARAWLAGLDDAGRVALLRVLAASFAVIFVVVRFNYHLDLARLPERRFDPVGIWWWLDRPLPVGLVAAMGSGAVAFGIPAALGWAYRLVAPLFALTLLAFLTYGHCWGQVLHTEHLLMLHLLVLGFSPAADRLSVGRTTGDRRPGDDRRYREVLWVLAAITTLTYVVAGYAKIRNGGMQWVTGDVLQAQIAHDNLRKELLGDPSSPIAGVVVRYGWLFPPIAAASLLAELSAPLALVVGRFRRLWVPTILVFHWATLALMAVFFPYHLFALATAPLLLLGWRD